MDYKEMDIKINRTAWLAGWNAIRAIIHESAESIPDDPMQLIARGVYSFALTTTVGPPEGFTLLAETHYCYKQPIPGWDVQIFCGPTEDVNRYLESIKGQHLPCAEPPQGRQGAPTTKHGRKPRRDQSGQIPEARKNWKPGKRRRH